MWTFILIPVCFGASPLEHWDLYGSLKYDEAEVEINMCFSSLAVSEIDLA